MVTVVLAPDSFKESLSAPEVCAALEAGLRRGFAHPSGRSPAPDQLRVLSVPMADGGEGTTEALVSATGGRFREISVVGPLGLPTRARWGLLPEGTAVVECAEAAGLHLVPRDRRDPRRTTTYGVGQMIRAALDAGARRIVVGLGGSATNDGGAGMAQALGVRFFDASGAEVHGRVSAAEGEHGQVLAGGDLGRIAQISTEGLDPRLEGAEIILATDVTNPLTGPHGASAVYGPQKGATEETVQELDAALRSFGRLLSLHRAPALTASCPEDSGQQDVAVVPGAGAAGGLGAGFLAFTGARIRPGVEVVSELAGLEKACRGADLVITGEGRMDGQSLNGKTPMGVAQAAARAGVPVVAVAGSLGSTSEQEQEKLEEMFAAILPIVPGVVTLEEALAQGAANLERIGFSLARVWTLGAGLSGPLRG